MTENPYNYRQRSMGLGHKRYTNITQIGTLESMSPAEDNTYKSRESLHIKVR